MFDVGNRVKVTKEFYDEYLTKEIYKEFALDYNTEYIIMSCENTTRYKEYCEIKDPKSGWIGAVLPKDLIKLEELNSISQKSINSTMEELYEMIIKENCSRELQSKFWDLHRVLSSKEKEVKIRLEEINKLLWE